MKIIGLLLAFIYLTSSQISFPVNCFHHQILRYNQKKNRQHLKHLKETYKVNTRSTFFTLSLQIQGLKYDLTLDTGSSDLFIKGQKLVGSPKKKYSCQQCINNNKKYRIGYLDGSLQTYEKILQIRLGNHKFNESILVAYKSHSQNFNFLDGIIGLSFQQLARNPNNNFINTLIKNNIVKKYSFGMQLDLHNTNNSYITFGEPNQQFIQKGNQLKYFPIINGETSYKSRMSGILANDIKIKAETQYATFDTGNTCFSIPQKLTPLLMKQFNKNGNKCQWVKERSNPMFSQLSCNISNFTGLPKIGFYRDQQLFYIQKQIYIDNCKKIQNNQYTCGMLIQQIKWNRHIILGDTIFQRYYAYFDLNERKIGLVKNINNPTLSEILKRRYVSLDQ